MSGPVMTQQYDNRERVKCALGQSINIGLDDDLVSLPEMTEYEDLANDIAGMVERTPDRLGRVVRRREDGHLGADHPCQCIGKRATVG